MKYEYRIAVQWPDGLLATHYTVTLSEEGGFMISDEPTTFTEQEAVEFVQKLNPGKKITFQSRVIPDWSPRLS
jgi:hypothetical protein